VLTYVGLWYPYIAGFERDVPIDIGRLSRPLNPLFPLSADCVPVEMAVCATLLLSKNCRGGGQTVFQTFITIIYMRTLSLVIRAQEEALFVNSPL
jgi:hypothetical protein